MKIIKYGAAWCGPCRVSSQVLKDAGYAFTELDIDDEKNEEIVASKHIRSIPVIEFYKDSEDEIPSYTHIGLLTLEKLNEIVKELS